VTATRPAIVLGLESSCDETAAALALRGPDGSIAILAERVASQDDLHRRYGGVVPEIASRAHVERILPTVRDAMRDAGATFGDLAAIAVGHRPGLIGSLLVGTSAAKALAWSRGLPFLGVDHVEAHLLAGLIGRRRPAFPALGLVVSGGHTALFRLASERAVEPLGSTIDDAIGEAFDKAASTLGLGYPGGPALDRAARRGNPAAHAFPVAAIPRERLDFTFSGLKTSLLYAVRGIPARTAGGGPAAFPRDATSLSAAARDDLAASFEFAAVDQVRRILERALDRHPAGSLLVGGGASANTLLRATLSRIGAERGVDVVLPAMRHCVDNAAMIAATGLLRLEAGERDGLSLAAEPLASRVSAGVAASGARR
jgi:N6-L-threonylcarbamoyladenine synthase